MAKVRKWAKITNAKGKKIQFKLYSQCLTSRNFQSFKIWSTWPIESFPNYHKHKKFYIIVYVSYFPKINLKPLKVNTMEQGWQHP